MSDQLLQDPLQHENEHFEFSSTVNNLRNSRSDHEFVYSDVQRGRKPSSESLPEVRSIFELENGGGQSAPGSSKKKGGGFSSNTISHSSSGNIIDSGSSSSSTSTLIGTYLPIASLDTESLDPDVIAEILFHGNYRPSEVMDFLGKKGEKNGKTLKSYFNLYDFEHTLLIDALRVFTSTFYLKGEGQMVTRVLETFSERFYEQNPDIFPNSDCVYLLTTALVMLNTDLYSSQNSNRRMTKAQFVRNTALGLKELKMEQISEPLLEDMYNSIKKKELLLLDEDPGVNRKKLGVLLRRKDSVKGSIRAMSVNSLNVLSITNAGVKRRDSASTTTSIQKEKVLLEGYLCRKSVKESRMKRAANRSWRNWFVVLRGPELYFYKPLNLMSKMQDQLCTEILNIRHALADNMGSYKGRERIISLYLNNGAVIYLQASDSETMNAWIDGINYMAAVHSAPPPNIPVSSLLEEFFLPINPTIETGLEKNDQIEFINDKVKSLESDFVLHAKLLDASLKDKDFSYSERNRFKIISNWEKKRDYLNHEIRKYQRYQVLMINGMSKRSIPEKEPSAENAADE